MANPHTKFEVDIFSRSLDIEGVPKFKSRSLDPGRLPISPSFANFWIASLVVNLHTNFEVCIFSRSSDIEGVRKLKRMSRDPDRVTS